MPGGLLLAAKPPGVTSHDVVELVRRKLGMRRVGHTGTLDPMAEGLLVILVGTATKFQRAFQGHEKSYEGVLRLGVQTDTGDATGAPIRTAAAPAPDATRLAQACAGLLGVLDQQPPAFSAIKVQGRPAYWWARRQKPVALPIRTVHIHELTPLSWDGDVIAFRVQCSAGTYVRTLAESLAERLGTVGHLTRLVRLRIGRFRLEDALPYPDLQQCQPEELRRRLRPVEDAMAGGAHRA